MKGIVLSGGTGTRLLPLTAVTSKQLLPVYDRPMIMYPLNTLIKAGIKDILMIVAPENSGQYLNLFGSLFDKYGVKVSFIVQKSPRGIAEAFILGEDFIDNGPVTLVLGDNIFEDDLTEAVASFTEGGRIFAKEVSDPERFGVVEFEKDTLKALSIEEKPKSPKSNFAVPGIYIYDQRVVGYAKSLAPSDRGEIEITDINNLYLTQQELDVRILPGAWFDAGTHDALLEASLFAKEKKLAERFDPLVNQALQEFNTEFKKLVSLK